jgi:hypothetical protein
VYGAPQFTDATGTAALSNVPGEYDAKVTLENPWFLLYDADGDPGEAFFLERGPFWGNTNQEWTFAFDPNAFDPNDRADRVGNVWRWLNIARSRVSSWHPSFPLGEQVRVECNHPHCAPFYFPSTAIATPPQIQYGNGNNTIGCRCGEPTDPNVHYRDAHYNSIIVHEHGHHLHHSAHPLSASGLWQETISDAWSAYVIDSPRMGYRWCDCTGHR